MSPLSLYIGYVWSFWMVLGGFRWFEFVLDGLSLFPNLVSTFLERQSDVEPKYDSLTLDTWI